MIKDVKILSIIESFGGPSSNLINCDTNKLNAKLLPPSPQIPILIDGPDITNISYKDFIEQVKLHEYYQQYSNALFTVILGYFTADGWIGKECSEAIEHLKHTHVCGIYLCSRNTTFLTWIQDKLKYINGYSIIHIYRKKTSLDEDYDPVDYSSTEYNNLADEDHERPSHLYIPFTNVINKHLTIFTLEEMINEEVPLDHKCLMLHYFLENNYISIKKFGLHYDIRKTIQEYTENSSDPFVKVIGQ